MLQILAHNYIYPIKFFQHDFKYDKNGNITKKYYKPKKISCIVREIAQTNLKFLPSSFWTPYTAKPNGGSVTGNTSSLVAKLDLSGRLITEGGIGTT